MAKWPWTKAKKHAELPTGAPEPTFQKSAEEFRGSPFWFYNCLLDAEGTISRYWLRDLQSHPDYLTNFIGVLIKPDHLHGVIDGLKGKVEAPPLPATWHADLTEWAAVLRSVDLAGPHFSMAELGCGWGCWMNNAGAAARSMGKSVRLIGVEGDEDHIAYAHEALRTNGFEPKQYELVRGVAAAREGIALFPRQDVPGKEYGSEPVFDVSASQRDSAIHAGTHDALKMVPLSKIAPNGGLDLLHIDIQGGEFDFVNDCLSMLNQVVSYLVIGTHSREIEGALFRVLRQAGWRLEIERPAYLHLDEKRGPVIKIDGAQGWRNMGRLPD